MGSESKGERRQGKTAISERNKAERPSAKCPIAAHWKARWKGAGHQPG